MRDKLIKNFFSKDELKVYQKYCYNKIDENKDYTLDEQSFSPAWYKDPLMNGLLDVKLPIVERESKLKLYPTYAYWRYYVFGGLLKKHTDKWPIVVEGKSFELEEGDAVLYAGCDQEHWRPGVYEGEGMAQVFLHYVNQNGPNKDHAYDNLRING